MKEKENGGRGRETKRKRERERLQLVGLSDTLKTYCEPWSGLGFRAHSWEMSCPAIFVLPSLPSDVMLLVSQEVVWDKREAREYT